MTKSELIVCEGQCFAILWGLAASGTCQARTYYDALEVAERAKALALFKRLADQGKIFDETKFRQETKNLFVFKPQPHRFFCFFVRGRRVLIVSAYRKQGDKAPPKEIARAENLRAECLEQIAREEERHEKKKR
jgi:hypothetical protein